MIYKTIPITQRPDGSLSIDLKNIQIKQGDYDLYQLSYFANTNYDPSVDVQVSFRRKDGQQTGYISLTKVSNSQYILNMKSRWFTNEAGNLYLTIRAKKVSNNSVDLILYNNSVSIPITPVYSFNPIEDVIPTDFDEYKASIREQLDDIIRDQNATNTSILTLNRTKLDKDFRAYDVMDLSNLSGLEKIISDDMTGQAKSIPLKKVLNNIDTVNNVHPDDNKNIQIDGDNISTVYGNTINEEFVGIHNSLEDAVYNNNNNLHTISGVPILPVTNAVQVKTTKSNVQEQLDEIEHEIRYVSLFKGVFQNKQSLLSVWPDGSNYENGIWAILLDTDTIWIYDNDTRKWVDSGNIISDVFSVNGKFPNETGNILLTGADIDSTVVVRGTTTTKSVTSHLQDLYNNVNRVSNDLQTNVATLTSIQTNFSNRLSSFFVDLSTTNLNVSKLDTRLTSVETSISNFGNNYVSIDGSQIITGQKTFQQPIKLSTQGSQNIDTITNTTDGLSITSSSGKTLLDINETLETVSAFSKPLVYEDSMQTYVNSAVASLAGQNEYIGSYSGTTYTTSSIQTDLSSFVQSVENRSPRNGDLVNIVNSGDGVDYSGQQWIYNGDTSTWRYYITFETHEVINNLNSTSVNDGLAANQGRVLKVMIDGLQNELTTVNGKVDGITIPTKTSDLENDGKDGINPFITSDVSDLVNYYTDDEIDAMLEEYVSTSAINNTLDVTTSGFVLDARQGKILNDKIPTATSDITNDSGFINNTVDNLTNYYTKTETYTKSQVDDLLSGITGFRAEIVQTLPTTGNPGVVYLVPKTTTSSQNAYDEYMWINNAWENIGSTSVDLTQYYTKAQTYNRTEIDGFLNLKANASALENTNASITNLESDLSENYLPLTAGSGKSITGDLYTKNIVIDNTTNIKGKTTDGTLKQLIGVSSTNNMWINDGNLSKVVVGGTAIQPQGSNKTDLGSSGAAFKNIYGTTIYENGTSLSNKYLSISGKADDSSKLNGKEASFYLDYNNLTNTPEIYQPSDYITQGGTLTKPLTVTGGDTATAGKIILNQNENGQITDSGVSTIFGFGSSTDLTIGSTTYNTKFRGKQIRPVYNTKDIALSEDLENYLPLTAGSSKPLTGVLYANDNGIVVGKDASSANNNKGIVFGENGLTKIGASSSLGLYSEKNIYLRPGMETDANAGIALTRTVLYPTTNKSVSLGSSSNYFNNIYGTTIYQNGKQVANAEDLANYLPITGGTITPTESTDTPLKIKSTSTTTYIQFINGSGVTLGYFGVNSSKQPVFYDSKDNLLAYKTTLQTLYSGSATSGTITLSQNLASSSNDLIVFYWINDEKIYQTLAIPETTLYSINSSTYNLALRSTTATTNKTMTLHISGANTLAIDSNASNYITLKNIYRLHFS